MALILNIETSTNVCSIALAKAGEVVSYKESSEDKSHASSITVFVEEVFRDTNFELTQIEAVAVSKGPGSYTGLRIGVSTAKGIAYAIEKPLISVSTLQSLALGLSEKFVSEKSQSIPTLFCPMIDARRMEVYTAIFDHQNILKKEISAEIITEDSFADFLANNKLIFFGNGAKKCKTIIKHPNAVFIDNIDTSATKMSKISEQIFQNKIFEDLAYFEPFYLKDFVATIPRKNIFK
ncbi:MAG: tRNA (adenosine(37)-N6)-threonylcarbamoyltransferase complex dimerization subunit type 1 TsaB [Bacteroidetes bacterium]|nr:tRNA (adenosine(37)-N6)-threonylcarbamoyltransferase complex dimerization subunit type 1 TsaB [Bacteroidota bacterium]MBT6687827.1 tRNA (adenosine(37)-N6)-threonylcarbamoyltransferase complex dimerization subunit type 1 TsaB [Bacteroidota bacterium]MBT7142105.1 tRNA (adenosine(37)-N6)-threonylcarbamoyltransferase complex dimerization subunit type 1 TsaB [Bacteroidota bacterium]MBT7492376.1 tRNA (adenosine(37)-N6)-threonylcarbamoyltransferase complex dimerization subunit type 1 TsaB [Bacteroid